MIPLEIDYRLVLSQHPLLFLQPSQCSLLGSSFPFNFQSKKDKPIIRSDDPVMSTEYRADQNYNNY